MFNGIEISEARLLITTIVMTFVLLMTVGMLIWAFILTYDRGNNKTKERMKKLKSRAETDPYAMKELQKLKRKQKKNLLSDIISTVLAWILLIAFLVLNLSFAVIPGWTDYIKKDYVIYEGDYEVRRYTRDSYIDLADGTSLYGGLGLDEGVYYGKIVYSRRSGFTLGKG